MKIVEAVLKKSNFDRSLTMPMKHEILKANTGKMTRTYLFEDNRVIA
jgi:hypothetical protein